MLRSEQNKRPPFTPEEVILAMRSLAMLGWLALEPTPEVEADESVLVGS